MTDAAALLAPTLDSLMVNVPARIASVDWASLAEEEALRLTALGLDVGATVRVVHRGVFLGADPLAVEVGRMTVALRRVHARAMRVEALPDKPRPDKSQSDKALP